MNKETLQGYNSRLSTNNDTITNINSLLKRLPVSGEDLTEELTNYDSGLTTQETSIQDIVKALEGKAAGGGGGKYAPRYISFYNYGGEELTDELVNLDTSNMTSMKAMFFSCKNLKQLDIRHFDTSNVTDMYQMIYYCSSLTSLDLSNFNTSNVTDMYNMFRGSSGLIELDLSSFDTNNVTTMELMFSECSSLTKLNTSSFNTNKVTSTRMTFKECSSLTNLDLSSWDTSNVVNMQRMFSGCTGLTKLDIRNFVFSNVTTYDGIFDNIPAGCEIIVKDDTAKAWVKARRSALTNVKTVAELEAS